jgi:CubicO group peptidase (beta-lactamase class C family)
MVVPGTDVDDAQGAYVPASGRGLERLIAASRPKTTVAVGAPRPAGAVQSTELDDLVSSWRDEWHITGVITAIARSDGSALASAAGIDASTDQPMLANHSVPAHSITKSFTGALVAQLAAEGRLDLDAPLAQVVPEFPHANEITLRQLAQHTSGLIDTGAKPGLALALAGATPLLFTPGTETNYSDTAYFLLAIAAERVTGQSYRELVQQQLLDPLGLADTALVSDERWSAGGIDSTALDLATWATAFWGGAFGPDVTSQARRIDPTSNFGIGTFGYCPCLVADGTYDAELYGHLSAQGRLAWDPSDDLAVMIHTNEENDGARTIDAWTDLDWRIRDTVRNRPLLPTPTIPEADIADPSAALITAPTGS